MSHTQDCNFMTLLKTAVQMFFSPFLIIFPCSDFERGERCLPVYFLLLHKKVGSLFTLSVQFIDSM